MTRLLLVLATVAFFALALWGMRRGWLARGRRQGDLESPPIPPADLGAQLLQPLTGLYVGSTMAGSWQDRIVAGGLGVRADATATLHAAGVLIARQASEPVFIPAGSIVEASLAPGLAGKVVGAGGLLVIRWRLGGEQVDTGLRADDKTRYPEWVAALKGLVRT
ncbi:MAG: hypothetical protein JWN61_410 [Pseudonocardiales bacterium]|nr:hypothetical protein [Pseudonocardiales bacterium]